MWRVALLVGGLFGLGLVPASADGSAGTKIEVPLTVTGDDLLSAGVYDAKGELIRSLAYAKPVKAGTETLTWDGTTDLGLPAPAGAYHVKGVEFAQGPQINYVMKVGISGTPPYLTDDPGSGWGATHGPASAICANSKNLLAIFRCAESPRESGVQLMDLNGKIINFYSTFFAFDNRLACTMDEKNFYLALGHSSYGTKGLVVAKYDIDSPPRGKILCVIPVQDHYGDKGYMNGKWMVDVQGLALNDGKIYVPVTLDEKVYVIDTTSGAILGSPTLPSPRGIASFQGTVYALSGKTLVKLSADGTVDGTPLITGLDDPSGLAIDASGNFYISDGGASQQVKVFSPGGQPMKEIGTKGGRPRSGIYDPAGMLDPRGICVAPDGTIWVPEVGDDYEVMSQWSPDGKREKSFYNMHWSSGQGRLSPDRSELIFGTRSQEVNPGVTAYKLDLDHGTWEPSWHISQTVFDQQDVLIGFTPSGPRGSNEFGDSSPYLSFDKDMVQGTNGKTYLTGGDFSIYLLDPATKQIKLASLLYTHHVDKTPAGPYKGNYDQGKPNWLAWSDLNGDGKMSIDETTMVDNPVIDNVARMTTMILQPDLSVMMLGGVRGAPGVPIKWFVYHLKPTQVLPTGVPVYDWSKLETVTELKMPDFNGGDHDPDRAQVGCNVDMLKLVNNAAYVRLEPRPKAKLHLTGVDGDGWWASRNWRITPMKFDLATGETAWMKLGRRTPTKAKPGEMYYPGWGLAGSSHGVDFYADTLSQVWAWTDDGLYLGHVYNDNVGKSIYDSNSVFVELTGAYVYDIGDKTYITAGDHGIMMHEMTFPTRTPVDGGAVTLTAAQSANAQPWDPDGPAPGKRPTYRARSVFDFDKTALKSTRMITIDGKLDPAEWSSVPEMPLVNDGKKVGTVQVTFDKDNLYLAYNIQDANGLKNDGHELPNAPFVSGSYVDFDLAPDWSMPNRDKPAEGDVRIYMARITGSWPSDYQMAFWPVKQVAKNYKPASANQPQDIVSPAAQRHFDDVAAVPGLTFAYQVTDKGYTLEASVPFAALGINPARQPIVGFDASAAFSDAAGQVRVSATHWAGETETSVVDRPTSADLKPQTWGTLEFDRNPLPALTTQ